MDDVVEKLKECQVYLDAVRLNRKEHPDQIQELLKIGDLLWLMTYSQKWILFYAKDRARLG